MSGKSRSFKILAVITLALAPLLWVKAYWTAAIILILYVLWVLYFAKRFSLTIKKHGLSEWLWALAIALYAWWFMATCIVTIATVDSSGMAPSIADNSVWAVTKYQLGGAINTNNSDSYRRSFSTGHINRNDLLVFHNPDADTIAADSHFFSYHQAKRITGKKPKSVSANKISQRPLMLQRLIAMPDETVEIKEGQTWLNGQLLKEMDCISNRFMLSPKTPPNIAEEIRSNAISFSNEGEKSYATLAGNQIESRWLEWMKPEIMENNYPDPAVPFNAALLWNRSFMGPFKIPSKGSIIELTPTNLMIYKHIITHFENTNLEIKDGIVHIDGQLATTYKFKMNYYWVMGDNRQSAFDSRFFGFLPENHIVGIAKIMIAK